jgi:hypothetical protein
MSKTPKMSRTGRCPGRSILQTLLGQLILGPPALVLALLVTYSVGCATKDASGSSPKPRHGIVEYRRIAIDSLKAVDRVLHSLDTVAAQKDLCPPKVLAAFSRELERLQVDSIQLRARSKAMQARGDAYFDNWEENLARMKDARIRALAEQHHLRLQQDFATIKLNSQKVSEAFKPFLSGLRKIQSRLENDPAAVNTEVGKDLVRTTRQDGQQVEQWITAIRNELDAMAALVTPAKTTSQH